MMHGPINIRCIIPLFHMAIWGGGDVSHEKMQYSYSYKMLTGGAKPIRIIGGPDKRSSAVFIGVKL